MPALKKSQGPKNTTKKTHAPGRLFTAGALDRITDVHERSSNDNHGNDGFPQPGVLADLHR